MTITFDEETRTLLNGKNFAIVATLNPDGSPQTSVVWVLCEGDTVLFSSTAGRHKTRNLARDSRISLTVFDTGNPYHSVEIRGTAKVSEGCAREVQLAVSHKYLGQDPPADPEGTARVVVRVIPHKIRSFSA
ncbi:PPOX class F420-dependent oxidoreductase [Nonomuraea purpurea]|uniref:PPOX class F420-dependent oxidoreductase n=1 Tax=Nonomuraea purpurea TaxID=1849276 RepID=A0ABV8GKU4_9ACTN